MAMSIATSIPTMMSVGDVSSTVFITPFESVVGHSCWPNLNWWPAKLLKRGCSMNSKSKHTSITSQVFQSDSSKVSKVLSIATSNPIKTSIVDVMEYHNYCLHHLWLSHSCRFDGSATFCSVLQLDTHQKPTVWPQSTAIHLQEIHHSKWLN